MNENLIKLILENSGFTGIDVQPDYISVIDPSCILPVFDTLLDWAWIAICVFTLIMLFGWGILYIKNGVNINTVFNNAKSLILIFCVLSVVKPIVNVVYGDDLFARGCKTIQVSRAEVDALLAERNKRYENNDNYLLYENFDVVDSGIVYEDATVTETEN